MDGQRPKRNKLQCPNSTEVGEKSLSMLFINLLNFINRRYSNSLSHLSFFSFQSSNLHYCSCYYNVSMS